MAKKAAAGGRAQTSARSRTDDLFEPKPSGVIETCIAGHRYRLRRPLLGEIRAYYALLDEMAADEAAELLKPPAEQDTDGINARLLGWWRMVVNELSEGTLPEGDDDLPPWLLHRELITEVKAHWLSVPWGPGGSPSERQAASLMKLTGSLGGIAQLAQAMPAQPQS